MQQESMSEIGKSKTHEDILKVLHTLYGSRKSIGTPLRVSSKITHSMIVYHTTIKWLYWIRHSPV